MQPTVCSQLSARHGVHLSMLPTNCRHMHCLHPPCSLCLDLCMALPCRLRRCSIAVIP